MYDEYERAVTGRTRPRLGAGAIFGLILAGFLFTGVAATVAGYFFVRTKVSQAIERFEANPALTAAHMLARLDPQLRVLEEVAEGSQVALRDARTGEVARFDFQDLVEGSLRIRGGDGEDVSIDLRGDESGGSLVIDADGERLRVDLQRKADGATLVIDGPEGQMRLGSGAEALEPPAWLPRLGGRPARPRQVYSARSADGMLGAVAWEAEAAPGAIVEAYRRALEADGFEMVRQSASERGRDRQASLWARDRDGGRHAFVVAAVENDATAVLLGYGEGPWTGR
jgi:hypothetical protein